jgi:hypothetical protein
MARYLFVCSTVRPFQNIRQRELGTEFVHQKGLPAVALTQKLKVFFDSLDGACWLNVEKLNYRVFRLNLASARLLGCST